ncbi:hypothetical protein FRB94_014351 [Tulasnella sp. JGI-2019a]|nr:hypothetical protein FRB93_008621 [Tulasnella sp. JGI-2019a]KAG9007496.1 hypothetical protein FRB94_014351 [Tulasnella sp. JGI-2019a]
MIHLVFFKPGMLGLEIPYGVDRTTFFVIESITAVSTRRSREHDRSPVGVSSKMGGRANLGSSSTIGPPLRSYVIGHHPPNMVNTSLKQAGREFGFSGSTPLPHPE